MMYEEDKKKQCVDGGESEPDMPYRQRPRLGRSRTVAESTFSESEKGRGKERPRRGERRENTARVIIRQSRR